MKLSFQTPIVRHNGEYINREDATEHHINHSLHYGTWVFEWIRFYNTDLWPKVFKLKEHIERFLYSASVMGMQHNWTYQELYDATLETVARSGETDGYIRPIMYYGQWKMWVYPDPTKIQVECYISVWKRWKYLSDDPIKVKISKTRRIHPDTSDMSAKISGHYANSTIVSLEIKKEWYDEGLLLDTNWYIAEGPWENIFFIRWNKVFTPQLGTILPWITRATIIELFKKEHNITIKEVMIHPNDLMTYDEAFFVGTAAEVTPIASITTESWDIHTYTSGNSESYTMKMKHLYDDVVKWKVKVYIHWLS